MPAHLCKSDLLFVLAGRHSRKQYGLRLFQEGIAPLILLSTGRFEVRRFADLNLPGAQQLRGQAAELRPQERHFFVLFDGAKLQAQPITIRSFGTLNEIRCLARWLDQHPEIESLTIVSSGFHLPRVALCCRILLPRHQLQFAAAPKHEPDALRPTWRETTRDAYLLLAEAIKLPVYAGLLLYEKSRTRTP